MSYKNLEIWEMNLDTALRDLKFAAQKILKEATAEIATAALVGDGVTAKDMLARHTRAAKVLNALQNLEATP